MRLTDRSVAQLKLLETGQKRIRDDLLPGFGLTVGTKRKTFFVMYGQQRRLKTLGHYPQTTLQEARNAARRLLEAKPDVQTISTLKPLVEAYLKDCEGRLRPSSYLRFEIVLKNAPDIPLVQVDKSLATTVHEISAYKAMFNWAIREGIYSRNPFALLSTKSKQRHRVLSDEEIKAIWNYDHEPFSTIIKLLLLTGQRRSQIWKLQPDWIDGNHITFPEEVMKSGRQHKIYVPTLALPLLEKTPFTFNGWSKSKSRIDKFTGVTDWTIHDLRRTFATLHAQLGTPIHVIEAHLDHSSGTISGVAAIYIRHNFLAEAEKPMQAYARHIDNLVR